ncbi:MAG: WYL domain-containing protein [Bacteroidales bacterium]|nr:WYL domain-containing protein [Bacteroidales bacterium]HPD96603.1 WYL domain-containing protein [Tenuifilaceae bacterium]HRX32569.1 WYL domain-containing protein [Tenuifilaceae bacterium]
MTKRDYIIRYLLIIKKLRNSYKATFDEINDYIEQEFELMDTPKNISRRTFQRDISEIRTIFNIDIKCNGYNQYYIAEDEHSGFNNRMIEAFDVFNSLSMGQHFAPYVLVEKHCSIGTEYIYGILYAIKNNFVLKFNYHKFYENFSTSREVSPYSLKEYKGRWYVLSKDFKDEKIKSFALDRMKNFEVTKRKFAFPSDFNPNNFFENCFGIIKPDNAKPSEIILSFDPFQGKYIKSYPLHESQKTLLDNEEELRISIYTYETHDLVMELLSFGAEVQVLQPQSLINKISEVVKELNTYYI